MRLRTRRRAASPALQSDGLETAHFRHRHAAAERRQAVVAAALVVQRRIRAVVGFDDEAVGQQTLDERVERARAKADVAVRPARDLLMIA